jgi:hypothetical protein
MALRTILLTGLRILIAWPFHDPNSAKCHIPPGFSKREQYEAVCFVKSGIVNCDQCEVNKTWQA